MMCSKIGCMDTGVFGNRGEVVRRGAAHKKSSDADLERKICQHPGCGEQVEYGTETVAMRCARHRFSTDVKSRRDWCEEPGCLTPPIFGAPGCDAKRCGKHRICGDQDVVSRRFTSYWCIAQKDISQMGYATQTNPESGKLDLCTPCLGAICPRAEPIYDKTILVRRVHARGARIMAREGGP